MTIIEIGFSPPIQCTKEEVSTDADIDRIINEHPTVITTRVLAAGIYPLRGDEEKKVEVFKDGSAEVITPEGRQHLTKEARLYLTSPEGDALLIFGMIVSA